MARVGDLNRLFRTFLYLKTTCKKASLILYSDGSGNCQVTLRVTAPGHGYKTPRRGGDPSRSQEAAPGTLAPSSTLPAAPTTAAAATAPAPDMEFVTNFTRTYVFIKSFTPKYSVNYDFLGHEENLNLPPMLP